jgi:hypothetical protein
MQPSLGLASVGDVTYGGMHTMNLPRKCLKEEINYVTAFFPLLSSLPLSALITAFHPSSHRLSLSLSPSLILLFHIFLFFSFETFKNMKKKWLKTEQLSSFWNLIAGAEAGNMQSPSFHFSKTLNLLISIIHTLHNCICSILRVGYGYCHESYLGRKNTNAIATHESFNKALSWISRRTHHYLQRRRYQRLVSRNHPRFSSNISWCFAIHGL